MGSTFDNIIDSFGDRQMPPFIDKKDQSDDSNHDSSNIQNQAAHPAHYNNHPLGIECRDVIKCEPYYIASAIKYIIRRHDKGDYQLNIEKAIQCLRFQIDDPFCDMIRYPFDKHPSGIDIDRYLEPMNTKAKATLKAIFRRHQSLYKEKLRYAVGMIEELAKTEKGITLS